jgi:hypothetical protein
MDILKLLLTTFIDLIKWSIKKFKKPDPVLLLKRREELRKEFEKSLPPKNKYGYRCDAIIRDIKRMDAYPNVNNRKGISAWFRVSIKDLYYNGIEVFISMPQYIKQDEKGKWQFTDYKDESKVLVWAIGRIPFDLIEYVNWGGDEYYPYPHIYCSFKSYRGQPYECIPFYRKAEMSDDIYEVDNFRPWDKKKGDWLSKLKIKKSSDL